jgi:hypothetical protein
MGKPLRLQARDYDILRALLAYVALTLDLIEKFLFLEPGKTRSRCWERLAKLRQHNFITRQNVEKGVTVFLLTAKGRDLIISGRNVDPGTLWVDPAQIGHTITHWDHHLINCELHMMLVKAVDCLNTRYILDHSDLSTEIREVAKHYIESGWSRDRIFTRVNHLLYLQQSYQPVKHPVEWLREAIEANIPKPKGFSPKTFVSPLDRVNLATEGYQILNWKNDIALSRLKADQRLGVEYIPLNGKSPRLGQVEADHELTVGFFSLESSRPSRSYTLMLEFDSGSRPLELSTVAPRDADDNSFSTQIIKKVAMLETNAYQQIRGHRLDRIGVVVNGGEQAVENRVRMIEDRCRGKNAFMVASLETLKSLKNPSHFLTAPMWRRCGETTERYYPLIGTSSLDRYLQETRRKTKSETAVAELRGEIYEAAKRELYISLLSELDQAQMEQLIKEAEKGAAAANTWLSRWYAQRYGPTYLQSLAIFVDLEAERRKEEIKER